MDSIKKTLCFLVLPSAGQQYIEVFAVKVTEKCNVRNRIWYVLNFRLAQDVRLTLNNPRNQSFRRIF